MAWENWQNITQSDYMDISFIVQAENNINHIRNLIMDYLRKVPEHVSVDVSGGYQTQPTPDYLNLIERNLDYLENELTWLVNRGLSRTWLGEYADNPTFRYSDVNRWFNDLHLMKLDLDSIPGSWRISGTFSCGNTYLTQMLRR